MELSGSSTRNGQAVDDFPLCLWVLRVSAALLFEAVRFPQVFGQFCFCSLSGRRKLLT